VPQGGHDVGLYNCSMGSKAAWTGSNNRRGARGEHTAGREQCTYIDRTMRSKHYVRPHTVEVQRCFQ
jgi:hypothetical protein